MVCVTGSIFGDNTSPGNFEATADTRNTRRKLAIYFSFWPWSGNTFS
jgi:hypothetical protein